MANFLRDLAGGVVGQDCQDVLTMVHQKSETTKDLSDEGFELLKGEIKIAHAHTSGSIKLLEEEMGQLDKLIEKLQKNVENASSPSEHAGCSIALMKAMRNKHTVYERICGALERLHYTNERSIEILDVVKNKVSRENKEGEVRGRMYM